MNCPRRVVRDKLSRNLLNNGGEPVENVLLEREPVECILHGVTDMAKLGDAANHPSIRPKNTIQGLQSNLMEATVERGAMIYTVNYKLRWQLKKKKESGRPHTLGASGISKSESEQ